MKEEKNIALNVVLSIVTCGIYAIVWFIQLTDDVKEASGDTEMQSGGIAFLLTLVTCGIYGLYWAYKMGKLMETAGKNHNTSISDNSVLYLILEFLGLGIVTYCLIQNDLNAIVKANNGGAQNTTV